MAETLSWSVGAGSPGGSFAQSGTLDAEAVTIASVSVDPAANKVLGLQLGAIDKLSFVAVKSTLYNDKVKVKADGAGATEFKLSGPVFLFGDAVKLLGPSLGKLTVTNDDAQAAATIEILIGHKLT